MLRLDLPFTEADLLLTPRFAGWGQWAPIAIVGAALLVAIFLVLRLYRHELRLVSRQTATLLLALRSALVVSLLLLICLRPVLARTTSEVVPARVLIGIDRSESMTVTDPQRSSAEKLELAKGLRLASDLVPDSKIDEWLRFAVNGPFSAADPRYDQLVARIDGLTRNQISRRVLAPEGANVLQAIGERHQLGVLQFNQQAGELPIDWAKLAPLFDDPSSKSTGNSFTDLKQPLIRGIERGNRDDAKLLGIVILTDGQHNWGSGPTVKALELGQRGVPIYFVATGPKLPPPDVALLSAKATPPTVFKNAYSTVEARVLINNMPPGKVKVTLSYPDVPGVKQRAPLVEQIDHDGTSGPRVVTFTARMERPGTETLSLTAEHTPSEPSDSRKDTRPENNSRQVVVNVSPEKAKVLLVDGEVRWEQHYLHTALIRDETMDTTSVVFDQPRLGLLGPEEAKASGLPDLELPRGPDALMGFDCIILGDVSAAQISRPDRDRLEKYVSERGGTLVLLAGKRSMPLDYLQEGEPLAKLLPISGPRVFDSMTGFSLSLTAEGQQTGFLRLDNNPGQSAETWANLPPHYWAITGKAKDGAVVLAHVPQPNAPKDANARETERNNAVIVRQNFGFGKVVYVGIDSTWRWRFKKGDTYNHRFWSQVIRWAASDRALVAGNEYVRFGAREPVYRADQEVEIVARFSDKAKKLAPEALAGARMIRKQKNVPEEVVGMVPLRPHPVIPKELDGAQANLPPGEYDIELAIPDMEDKLNGPDGKRLRAHVQILPADTGEMLDLSTNWLLMEDLAAKTGGKVFSADRAGELVELLQSRTATREHSIEQKLNQSWWALALFVGLLTAEWIVRKLSGLP